MSNLIASPVVEPSTCDVAPSPVLEAIPARRAELSGLAIDRFLPRSRRRLVGPWCFLDAFGPLGFDSGKPIDVPPHPHIGLQTVSWILEGEVLHNDSLGLAGMARPGVLNLMTAGRGIAHAEETPPQHSGRLHGVQLWVALPQSHRATAPGFEQHEALPVLQLPDARATVILGELGELRSPARVFSPIVGAELQAAAGATCTLPLEPGFEHALIVLRGETELDGARLAGRTLFYLGTGRRELRLASRDSSLCALLLGGAPFRDTVLMWWNFVGGSNDEIVAARDDWESGRRFGEVSAYSGPRLAAPPFGSRMTSGR